MDELGKASALLLESRLTWMCQLSWSSWLLHENSGSIRSPAPLLDSLSPWWIDEVPITWIRSCNHLNHGGHTYALLRYGQACKKNEDLTTSAMNANTLGKRRLFVSTIFVSERVLLGADISCLANHFLSDWWSYYLLISRI